MRELIQFIAEAHWNVEHWEDRKKKVYDIAKAVFKNDVLAKQFVDVAKKYFPGFNDEDIMGAARFMKGMRFTSKEDMESAGIRIKGRK